jgi:hypothetical protein
MFEPSQVLIGRGGNDDAARDSALVVAKELHAAGLWDGQGQLIVHFPRSIHERLRQSAVERFEPKHRIAVHAGVHTLRCGVDYKIEPPRELDPANWQQLKLFD